MDEKELDELRSYAQKMREFVSKQESVIVGVEQRFDTIYKHHKVVARLTHSAKSILAKFDLKEKDEIKLMAIWLKKFILTSFGNLIEEEIMLMKGDSAVQNAETRSMAVQRDIFASNYLKLKNFLKVEGIKKTEAAKKLKEEMHYIKKMMGKQNKRHDISSYLVEIMKKSDDFIKDIKDLVLDELGVLDTFIFEEKYIPNKEKFKIDLMKLNQISGRLNKVLKNEKREVIEPIKGILKDKKSIDDEIAASIRDLRENKEGITIKTIQNDLRRMTTKPEEVRAYAFAIMQPIMERKGSFDPAELANIIRYLRKVQGWSEIISKEQEAIEDQLTKVGSRKRFDYDLEKAIAKARRNEGVFSLAFIDIDNFKDFNDTYGHQTGDSVLAFLGNVMKRIARAGHDEPYRYGGEEFCMIYSDTDKRQAKIAAERLRNAVRGSSKQKMAEINLTHDKIEEGRRKEDITISIGIATYPEDAAEDEDERSAMVKKADDALYFSKRTGRNKVTAAKEHVVLERKREKVAA
jgi:diguanylate cyclase (GGDEF)-like protein